jgi:hypothetical protein
MAPTQKDDTHMTDDPEAPAEDRTDEAISLLREIARYWYGRPSPTSEWDPIMSRVVDLVQPVLETWPDAPDPSTNDR